MVVVEIVGVVGIVVLGYGRNMVGVLVEFILVYFCKVGLLNCLFSDLLEVKVWFCFEVYFIDFLVWIVIEFSEGWGIDCCLLVLVIGVVYFG